VEQRKQGRGWHQHFIGSWARFNCEEMPVIPAWLVRSCLNDPRGIPYLLVWKGVRDGQIKEAVRLTRQRDFPGCEELNRADTHDYMELKRHDAGITILQIVWRRLPRNGGRALLLRCPNCETPRRYVYGWEWASFSGWLNRVISISWRCRPCARLRYSSEGGALVLRGGPISRLLRLSVPDMSSPRPAPWLPYVFTSAKAAAEAGVCAVIGDAERRRPI
jgi:hypothetical protein